MKKYQIIIIMSLGLESLTKWQLERMGYDEIVVKNGRIEISGTIEDIAMLNLKLSTADRVLILLDSFNAVTFEELYEKVYDFNWLDLLDERSNFLIQGTSKDSKLFSISDCQRITERAIIDRLQTVYDTKWFEKKGPRYQLQISLVEDKAELTLDTTGPGLHKRGYRQESGKAPLRENLARALIELSFYSKERPFIDLFCGSGTLAIEAAHFARNIAPGINRDFDYRHWSEENDKIFHKLRRKALKEIDFDSTLDILASDIHGGIIDEAIKNAEKAGVKNDIRFITRDFRKVQLKDNYGVLISNPPYGLRMSDKKEEQNILKDLGKKMKNLKTYSWYIITPNKNFEKIIQRKADRRRKLYNGNIETQFYQFYGPKPKR